MIGLDLSVFKSVFYPFTSKVEDEGTEDLKLRRSIRFRIDEQGDFRKFPIVIFDFETTGLDPNRDQIIEVGAIKYSNFEPVEEFSSLVSTKIPLTDLITRLTGITPDMLVGQPSMEEVLPRFLNFIEGSLLVAHNASFDMGFLRAACQRQGVDIEWPVFCTLKMAREYLVQLERKSLDSLAEYYGLEFEARHRSIGDVKVTGLVLKELLSDEGAHLKTWSDLGSFRVA
jgi:DNA polymerase III epsilon subunit family exonuclease